MSTAAIAPTTFGQRFVQRAEDFGPVCIGLDPHASILRAWGLTVDPDGLARFSRICVEAFADVACVVKPQVAFYEALGSAGYAVLERTIAEFREAGVLVLADAKRGDIGSTMAGYASAWLDDDSPLAVDAVTLSPWLGVDSLVPAFDMARQYGKGAIVLAATSNPEAPPVQLSSPAEPVAGAATLAQDVVNRVAQLNAADMEATGAPAGNFGVVVGATVSDPPELEQVGGMILMPGVGAQGGTMADIRRICGPASHLASPNVSRGVLAAGPDPELLAEAARALATQCR